METQPHRDATGVKGSGARLETSAGRQQSNQKLFFGEGGPMGFLGVGGAGPPEEPPREGGVQSQGRSVSGELGGVKARPGNSHPPTPAPPGALH